MSQRLVSNEDMISLTAIVTPSNVFKFDGATISTFSDSTDNVS
jgi:hypothetical protein